MERFFARIDEFATAETSKGKPRHESLVANRRDRVNLPVRYALLVSLHTDAVATDIYTPIAAQIGIPVEIAT